MIVGHPKSAKTGSLVSLINSGRYKVGILDFDNNPDPLTAYVQPEFRQNVSIITLEDSLRNESKFVGVSGEPTALRRAFQALDQWKDGDQDWGPVKSWGPDHVLVIDSLTSMGEAAFRRTRFVNNRNILTTRDSDWGAAMKDQESMIEKVTSSEFRCNVVALCHLKMIGPKIERIAKEDSADLAAAKAAISLKNAEEIETKWYPSALGRALPQTIGMHFPAMVLAETRNGRRVILTTPTEGLELGVPAPHIKPELPVETGLLTIFDAIRNQGTQGGPSAT